MTLADHAVIGGNGGGMIAYVSIKDVTPDTLTEPFHFVERETIRAMEEVGITTSDLVKMSAAQVRNIPGTPGIRQRIANDIEEQRVTYFQTVVEMRDKLIEEAQTRTRAATEPASRAALSAKPAVGASLALERQIKRLEERAEMVRQKAEKEKHAVESWEFRRNMEKNERARAAGMAWLGRRAGLQRARRLELERHVKLVKRAELTDERLQALREKEAERVRVVNAQRRFNWLRQQQELARVEALKVELARRAAGEFPEGIGGGVDEGDEGDAGEVGEGQ